MFVFLQEIMVIHISKSEIIVRKIITLLTDDNINRILATQEQITKFSSITNQNKKNEFLASRILVKERTNQIQTYKNSKPIIDDGYISISHKNDFIVLGVNFSHPIGVDIEKKDLKINKIKHKFCSTNELNVLNKFVLDDTTILTMLWTAKEAVFKNLEVQNNIFIKDISIKIESHEKGIATIHDCKYELTFIHFKTEEYIICHSQKI